jgi:hypothetical protein
MRRLFPGRLEASSSWENQETMATLLVLVGDRGRVAGLRLTASCGEGAGAASGKVRRRSPAATVATRGKMPRTLPNGIP